MEGNSIELPADTLKWSEESDILKCSSSIRTLNTPTRIGTKEMFHWVGSPWRDEKTPDI